MSEKARPSASSGPSILIVDDNISQCKTMSFILGRKGYAVTTVQERPFDLIFMDIKIPLMDGVETYKRKQRT